MNSRSEPSENKGANPAVVVAISVGLVLAAMVVGPLIARAGDRKPNPGQKGNQMNRAVQVHKDDPSVDKVVKSDAEWRRELAPEEYHVLRQKGTEPPFSGDLVNNHAEGVYVCAGCGQVLFSSKDKYDSGSGWPSYTRPIDPGQVEERRDSSHGMVRTEVVCSRCGGHLGHVFDDGPAPTGLRYCINSAAMDFEPADAAE